MGEKSIGYKRMVDVHEAVSYLEALAWSFHDGRIVVAHGGKTLGMEPPRGVGPRWACGANRWKYHPVQENCRRQLNTHQRTTWVHQASSIRA